MQKKLASQSGARENLADESLPAPPQGAGPPPEPESADTHPQGERSVDFPEDAPRRRSFVMDGAAGDGIIG